MNNNCPGGGRAFAPFKSCSRGLSRGMFMDEIDTFIRQQITCVMIGPVHFATC